MDAIRLRIAGPHIRDKSWFPEKHINSDDRKTIRILTNNTLRKQYENHDIYAPNYHVEQVRVGGYEKETLVVEFSAPKLLYGNNLQEVEEKDLSLIVRKLKVFLRRVGVTTTVPAIRSGIVTAIEYAKNIKLEGFCSTSRLLKILSLFDYRPKSEFSSITRGSHSEVKFYNKSSRFTAYDKLLEVRHCVKTREEKEIARCIADSGVESPYRELISDTVRFELALQTREAVNAKMKQWYRHRRNYTLEHVFKNTIRDKLLREEVERIFDYPLLPILLLDNERVEWELIESYTDSLEKRQQLYFAVGLLRQSGVAQLRETHLRDSSRSTWNRISKELKHLSEFARSYLANRPTNAQIVGFIQESLDIVGQESNTPQNSVIHDTALINY